MTESHFRVRKGLVVNATAADVSVHIASNDAILVPVGNTGQRPSAADGYFRYNSELGIFEGVTQSFWGAVGSGGGYYKGSAGTKGTAGNKDNIFRLNSNTLTANVTIEAGENAQAAGPITIDTGVTLEIETNGRVSIV